MRGDTALNPYVADTALVRGPLWHPAHITAERDESRAITREANLLLKYGRVPLLVFWVQLLARPQ